MKKFHFIVSLFIISFLLLFVQNALAQRVQPPAPKLGKEKIVFPPATLQNGRLHLPAHFLYMPVINRNSNAPVANRISSCLPDTIILTTQAQIDNFATDYPTCTNPKYLFIDGTNASPAITNLNGLSGITDILDGLKITKTSITSLSQMTSLTSIKYLLLKQNILMTSIGLNNLTYLDNLEIRGLTALTSLNGLSNSITGISEIRMDSTNLTNLAGLSNLTSLEYLEIMNTPIPDVSSLTNITHLRYLSLQNDPVLTGIGLSNITSMDGLLLWNIPSLVNLGPLSYKLTNKTIYAFNLYNTGLTDLSGLDSLSRLEQTFIGGNLNMTSLHGLENVTAIDNGLSIWYNPVITDITALSNVTSIFYDRLEVSGNSSLTSLNGLGNLLTIGGGLWMQDNGALTSLSALNNNLDIQSSSGNPDNDTLRIRDNYQLSFCASPPICNFLVTSSSSAIFDNNAPGCNTHAEIQATCNVSSCSGGVLKTWTGVINNGWHDAGNWSPAGIPDLCDSVLIPSGIFPYPALDTNITIAGLKMENGSRIDMNLHDIIINGDINLDNVILASGNSVYALHPNNPQVKDCNLFLNSLSITGFTGQLQVLDNNIHGDVTISDSVIRNQYAKLKGNTVDGNLNITTNTLQPVAFSISSGYDDYVTGNAVFTTNTDRAFYIGGPTNALHIGKSLILKTDFNNILIDNIDFNANNYSSHITQLGTSPVKVKGLSMNNYFGSLTLDQDVTISIFLDFVRGNIISAPNKVLVFENAATWYFHFGYCFVEGPVKKIGNQPFQFPIGRQVSGINYRAACFISAPSSITDAFTATYFRSSPTAAGYDTSLHVPSLATVRGSEYWTVEHNNGTSPVNLTLSYDSARGGGIPTPGDLRIANWDGSQWIDDGNGGVNGNATGGTVITMGSVSSFGAFALGLTPPHRKPIITLSNIDTLHCSNSFWYLPFTLDTLANAGNRFEVQLSDTLGNFGANPVFVNSKITATSDSIYIPFPASVIYGREYKIRVVGNLPADTSINTKTVVFRTPPLIYQTIIGPSPVCMGTGPIKYYPQGHEAGATYNWTVFGGTFTTNGDTALVTWTIPAITDYIQVVASNSFCGAGAGTIRGIDARQPAPTVTPTINNTGRWLYLSTTPPSSINEWYRNGTLIVGATASTYYASIAGNYTAKFSNFCGASPVSNTISFTAASLPQTITFPAIPNKVYTDAPFTPGATASSGLPVSYMILSGPATYNTQTNLVTIIGTGVVTIKATQPGDNIYDTAAPVTKTFTVNKGTQVITFTAIPDQDLSAGTVTLAATSSSGLPVTYSIVSGPATVSGNTVTLTGVGTITVRASQTGDTNYLPATVVDKSFCSSVSVLNHITGFTNLCPGTASYTVNNIAGATYTWRIVGGSTLASTTNTTTVNWASPGIYKLLVSAIGNCGTASMNDTLVVNVINSILPDSVHGMLPANGAINQQLPLTLSWIPEQPGNFYNFDLYIWQASASQPATPYAAGLTALSYIIPVSSGLLSNTAYKWMVVAHNGSCVQINTGPVQQFTLIPLPDLQVLNVQAPPTAFSGQTISINWTVKNNGPGITTTSQNWTDAVFLSYDTIPQFSIPPNTTPGYWSQFDLPVRPLLIGTKPNVSALNQGEQYTNSLNFTLPVNYSQPLYAYVITNYPAGIYAPQEVNYTNDTARAPQPIIVTLSPTPDLRVDSVFASNSIFSGSNVNVTYKVKNYGVVTPPGVSWVDKFYISQTATFNPATAVLLNTPTQSGRYYECYPPPPYALLHTGQLNADASYTNVASLAIPNFINGPYFIHVFTNPTNTLYEGALNNNNTNSKQVQVFLTPTPELAVSSINVPVTTASTTQPIGVNWYITNSGFYDNIEKNQGHYAIKGPYCGDFLVGYTPPLPLPGNQPIYTPGFIYSDSLAWGSSYYTDKIYLSRDSGNISTANLIQVGTYDHGTVSSAIPCYTLGCLPVAYPGYYDRNVSNVIKPNTDYPSGTQIIIPDTLSEGNYYIYVLANANKSVYEYPGIPRYKISGKIGITKPDLIPPVVSVPASVVGGQAFNIIYSIKNTGSGAVYNHVRNDKIYVSTSPVFNGSAQLISTQTYTENLPVGISLSHSFSYTFPVSASGTRYFYVHTNPDSLFRETNANNNISAAASTFLNLPTPVDLTVSSIQMADTVPSVFPARIKYTVLNNGTGNTNGSWTDSIFVSCSPAFSSATSYYISKRLHAEVISTGNSYTDSFTVNMPFTFRLNACFPETYYNNAYFFVKTNADNGVYEGSNTGNNLNGSGLKTIFNPLVDHIVTVVNGPDSAIVGRPYTTSWTIKNLGYNPGGGDYYNWPDGVFFSPDSVFNSNAVFTNYNFQNNLLNHNQTYSDNKTVVTPNLPTGDYYVYAYSNYNNYIQAEKIRDNNYNLIRNNLGAAKKIHVTKLSLPDLKDNITSAPSIVATGQPLTVVHQVSNIGAGVTYPNTWNDELWLSSDFIPANAGDILLSLNTHAGNLLPGEFYNYSATANISLSVVPGNYVLISRTNVSGAVFETDMSNNIAFRYITVYRPAPADLIVTNVMKPDTAYLGYTMDTAKWVIKNNSPNAATGYTSDGIYLSKSTTLDSTAKLLAIVSKLINMAPLASDTISWRPLVTDLTEGYYNLLVKTDLLNNIYESDKTNNTGISVTPVFVSVKELPLNVLTPNTLLNSNLYYKLIIPDSLNGATIQVSLKSADSLSRTNQMFIGKGYVPTAAHFDYKYGTPNYGNQDIVMTAVTAGVYYISVRAINPGLVPQNITLLAVKLPFTILTVLTGSGGNIGNVTVKISGSLYTQNMAATLSKPGTTITASAVYYSNSTTVYATFNLQGKPLGIYDVTLTKPDTSMAVLANGFSVVNANNGGLNNGGGTNTGSGNGNSPGCDPGAAGGINSQLVVEVVAPAKVFGGWPFIIQINYNNPTNVDIPSQARTLFNDNEIPMALTAAGAANGTSSLYLQLTEQNGPPGIIRAGGSGTITIYAKVPDSVPGHTIVNFNLK